TFGYLSALGLGEGWRCWEVGAGSGSVVRWIAAQVGESGSVLGTDLNLDWIDTDMPRQVELSRHDVTSDEIPSSAYDLIHARLVLIHLPQRDQVIERLVAGQRDTRAGRRGPSAHSICRSTLLVTKDCSGPHGATWRCRRCVPATSWASSRS